jgi:hypothetical protein
LRESTWSVEQLGEHVADRSFALPLPRMPNAAKPATPRTPSPPNTYVTVGVGLEVASSSEGARWPLPALGGAWGCRAAWLEAAGGAWVFEANEATSLRFRSPSRMRTFSSMVFVPYSNLKECCPGSTSNARPSSRSATTLPSIDTRTRIVSLLPVSRPSTTTVGMLACTSSSHLVQSDRSAFGQAERLQITSCSFDALRLPCRLSSCDFSYEEKQAFLSSASPPLERPGDASAAATVRATSALCAPR